MKQFTKQVAALAIMSSFFLEALFLPLPVASAAPAPQQALWQQPYHFRREVTVSNPASVGLENYPVVLTLTFAPNHLFDATDELRVFNASGVEVPSLVLGEKVVSGSVVSASLLFPISLPADSNGTFWLYYGDLQAGLPSYRVGASSSSIGSGLVSVSLGSAASSYTTFKYAGTYSQALEPFVSYSSVGGSFSGGLVPLSGWESYEGGTLAGATFTAGTLRVSEAVVASNSSLVSVYQFRNQGDSPVTDAKVSLVLNDSELARLGPLTANYFPSTGLATVSTTGAYLNFLASPLPSSNLVAPSAQISGALGMKGSQAFTPDSILLTWNIGSLPPGSAYTVEGALSVTSTSGPAVTPAASPTVEVGEEQTSSGDFVPSLVGIWNAQVNLSNVNVPSVGTTIPLTVENGTWLPRTLSVQGTMTYTLGSASFAAGNGGGWIPGSSATGNATGYASPRFWSVAENSYTGRIAIFSYDVTGASKAYLSSPMVSATTSNSSYFLVNYRASASASQGDYAQQQFYVALNVYNGTTEGLVSSLYFPVTGSSATVNETTSCGSAPESQAVSPTVKPTLGGYLIGDGTWRTLDANVGGLLSSSGMQFQILFCATSTIGFVGSMNLQVRSAGVQVTSPLGSLLGVSLKSDQSLILSLPKGLFGAAGGADVTLSVEMEVMAGTRMNQTSGTQFTSYLPEPNVSAGEGKAGLALSPEGVVLYTPLSGLAPALEVNGSAVQGLESSDGIIYASGGSLSRAGLIDSPAVSLMQLSFGPTSLGVEVRDAGGSPLAGAIVRTQAQGSAFEVANSTTAVGRATFSLLPWNYSVTVSYAGSTVYHSVVNLNSSHTAVVTGSAYGVTVRANDLLGHSLGTADIQVSGYGFSKALTTTDGTATITLPANTPYNATVYVDGIQYFAGKITATSQGSTVTLDTSYISTTVELAIGAAVVVVLVGVALYLNRPFLLRVRAASGKGGK